MKVGLVSPYDFASPGGVTDHVRHLAAQLRDQGQEVRIFAPSSRADIDFDTPEFYRIGTPIAVSIIVKKFLIWRVRMDPIAVSSVGPSDPQFQL